MLEIKISLVNIYVYHLVAETIMTHFTVELDSTLCDIRHNVTLK
jgi:hypothetical protein